MNEWTIAWRYPCRSRRITARSGIPTDSGSFYVYIVCRVWVWLRNEITAAQIRHRTVCLFSSIVRQIVPCRLLVGAAAFVSAGFALWGVRLINCSSLQLARDVV